MERYPVAGLETVTVVCSAGEVNGAFFGTLGQMRQMCEGMGADFSTCTSNAEVLAAVEAFEDAQNAVPGEPTAEERIAAALEYQNLASM